MTHVLPPSTKGITPGITVIQPASCGPPKPKEETPMRTITAKLQDEEARMLDQLTKRDENWKPTDTSISDIIRLAIRNEFRKRCDARTVRPTQTNISAERLARCMDMADTIKTITPTSLPRKILQISKIPQGEISRFEGEETAIIATGPHSCHLAAEEDELYFLPSFDIAVMTKEIDDTLKLAIDLAGGIADLEERTLLHLLTNIKSSSSPP